MTMNIGGKPAPSPHTHAKIIFMYNSTKLGVLTSLHMKTIIALFLSCFFFFPYHTRPHANGGRSAFTTVVSSFKHSNKTVSIFCMSRFFLVNFSSKWISTFLTLCFVSVVSVGGLISLNSLCKLQMEWEFRFPQSYWEFWNFCYLTGPRNWVEAFLLSWIVTTNPGVSSSIFYFFASNFLLKVMHAVLKNGKEEPLWSVKYLVQWVPSAGRACGELVYPAERSHY